MFAAQSSPTVWKTCAALLRSSRNNKDVSSASINPSLEGTLALSLTDCVWTESFCTDLSGLMMWMPSPSTSPVTLPKSVKTPTWPVGIEVVLANSTINSTIAPPTLNARALNPAKFGIAFSEPPTSKPPRPVVVIFRLRPRLGRTEPLLSTSGRSYHALRSLTQENFTQSGWESVNLRFQLVPGISQEIHTPATRPLYLVWFVLDTTDFPLHNPASWLLLSRGDTQTAHRDHWGKHHAIFAGLDCAVHQSRVFRTRTLAARPPFGTQRRAGILPKLWKLPPGCAPAHWAGAAHGPARPGGKPAPPAKTTVNFLLASRPNRKDRSLSLRSSYSCPIESTRPTFGLAFHQSLF